MRRPLRRRGGNAIEFALVLPALLLMLGGIIDFGWVALIRNGAVTAAREGARAGAFTKVNEDPVAAAEAAAMAAWNRTFIPAPTPTADAVLMAPTRPVIVVEFTVPGGGLMGILPQLRDGIVAREARPLEDQP